MYSSYIGVIIVVQNYWILAIAPNQVASISVAGVDWLNNSECGTIEVAPHTHCVDDD